MGLSFRNIALGIVAGATATAVIMAKNSNLLSSKMSFKNKNISMDNKQVDDEQEKAILYV